MTIDVMSELTVGFVGLGNMGWPMAANLHAAGTGLVVRDADPGQASLNSPPAIRASPPPPRRATSRRRTSWSPCSRMARSSLTPCSAGESAAALRPGSLVVEMSSADPADTRRTAAGLAAHGVHMVDAPVSGGVPRAVTGELALMVGGDDADVARVQPVLRVLGDPARQFRTGALGTGHAMKALNNVIGAAPTAPPPRRCWPAPGSAWTPR